MSIELEVTLSTKTIRETLAAFAVIASLLFVGAELKQSNAQAKAAAYQAIGVATASFFDSWAHDAEFAALDLKDPADMTPAEWRRVERKFTGVARLGEMILLQIEQGVLDEDAMKTLGYSGWRTIFNPDDPRVGCVWPTIRPGVSEAFRAFVEDGRDPTVLDCSGYTIR